MLLVTPDSLAPAWREGSELRHVLQRLESRSLLLRCVVDEGHCVSTWGRSESDRGPTAGSGLAACQRLGW